MTLRILLTAGMVVALVGCGPGGGGKVCKAPVESKAVAAPVAPPPAAAVYDGPTARVASDDARACVQRYAWKLARSKDETPVVAQAAVTACDAFVAATTEIEGGGARDLNAAHEANVAAMTRWATLYVVQYRANVCD
jgi:hypothetical protein